MIDLLLDPWVIDNLLKDSRALRALSMSVNIARELGLGIARFIDGKIEAAMWAQQEQAGALRGTAAANVHRDLEYFRIAAREETEALVANEPAGLPKIWHQALRGCIGDGAEWRNPRIVTPQVRRSDWPAGDEVTVRCSDINLADPLRVLESIESYRAHPFFVPDLDPWDLGSFIRRRRVDGNTNVGCRGQPSYRVYDSMTSTNISASCGTATGKPRHIASIYRLATGRSERRQRGRGAPEEASQGA
jgi:hypothetical protein